MKQNSSFWDFFFSKNGFRFVVLQQLYFVLSHIYYLCETSMQFLDGSTEVELRLQLGGRNVTSSRDIFVDANGSSLTIKVQHSGSFVTLMETNQLFDKIKPAETIWFVKLNHMKFYNIRFLCLDE